MSPCKDETTSGDVSSLRPHCLGTWGQEDGFQANAHRHSCQPGDFGAEMIWNPWNIVTAGWSIMLGWRGGLARVQLCWNLAKYSPLHHASCSQIVHVRKLRFRLGGVSFFVASIHLPSCSLRNMISFVHRHVYDLFDHFFENLNGFLNPYSGSPRFFVLNFTPFITLMSKVCGIFLKSFPCVICLTRNTHV